MGSDWSSTRLRASRKAKAYLEAGLLTVAETLWPTRCVLCEAPGDLVCNRCESTLQFIDLWQACPCCGAPNGMIQCTECNALSLASAGVGKLPFQGCASSVLFDAISARIVTCHKDAGEQGLADYLGYRIACVVPPEWVVPNAWVVPIPASRKAVLRRGFDHGAAIGDAVSRYLGVPCHGALGAGKTSDQRGLSREQRFANMRGAFHCVADCKGVDAILVDDVYTTGATVFAAAETLMEAGASSVRCATFARVC